MKTQTFIDKTKEGYEETVEHLKLNRWYIDYDGLTFLIMKKK